LRILYANFSYDLVVFSTRSLLDHNAIAFDQIYYLAIYRFISDRGRICNRNNDMTTDYNKWELSKERQEEWKRQKRMYWFATIVAILFMFLGFSVAKADTTIQTTTSITEIDSIGYASSAQTWCQSILATQSGDIEEIYASLSTDGTVVDDLRMGIIPDSGGSPASFSNFSAYGDIVGSTLPGSNANPGPQIVFSSGSPYYVVNGATFWVCGRRTGSYSGVNYYNMGGASPSAYADGLMKRYDGSAWQTRSDLDWNVTVTILSSSSPPVVAASTQGSFIQYLIGLMAVMMLYLVFLRAGRPLERFIAGLSPTPALKKWVGVKESSVRSKWYE